jgi:hypothetical protein
MSTPPTPRPPCNPLTPKQWGHATIGVDETLLLLEVGHDDDGLLTLT